MKFNSIAWLDQVIRFHIHSKASTSSFIPDIYIFGTSRQIVVTATMHIQIIIKNMTSTINNILKTLHSYKSNCRDLNIHVQLPLSFDLIDINFRIRTFNLTSIQS